MVSSADGPKGNIYRLVTKDDKTSLVSESKGARTWIRANITKRDQYNLKKIVEFIKINPEVLSTTPLDTVITINRIVSKYNFKNKNQIDFINVVNNSTNGSVDLQPSFHSQNHAIAAMEVISSSEITRKPTLLEAYNEEARQIEAFSSAFITSEEMQKDNKDCIFFKEVIRDLKDVTMETYGSEPFKSLVEGLLERADSRLQLRMIAYALFAGMKAAVSNDHDYNEVALFYLLNDPLSDKKDISATILKLMSTVKVHGKRKTSDSTNSDVKPEAKPVQISSNEEVIKASHGGGLFFLVEFLKGDSRGYTAEKEYDGAGVFLYAKDGNPNQSYAQKSMLHFDIPTILKIEVPKLSVEGTNVYDEVVLRKDKVDSIQRTKLSPLKKASLDIDKVKWTEGFLGNFSGKEKEKISTSVENVKLLHQRLPD